MSYDQRTRFWLEQLALDNLAKAEAACDPLARNDVRRRRVMILLHQAERRAKSLQGDIRRADEKVSGAIDNLLDELDRLDLEASDLILSTHDEVSA